MSSPIVPLLLALAYTLVLAAWMKLTNNDISELERRIIALEHPTPPGGHDAHNE